MYPKFKYMFTNLNYNTVQKSGTTPTQNRKPVV